MLPSNTYVHCACPFWVLYYISMIRTLLVPMETGINTLWGRYNIYNFTPTMSPHYLIKLKPHKTAHFEVDCHSILFVNSKNESMS